MKKKNFKELVDDLQYFSPENAPEKTKDEIVEEIREFIRKNGWDCLGDVWSIEEEAEEWFEDNHPEVSEDDVDDSHVCDIEFLCQNEYYLEHDVDWRTVFVGFYGVWGKVGIFYVQDC